ncbi:glycosyltransferase family 2 protein [Halomicrococcus sp. NG-SE-24]|uniref:glycosyltransferase family 2 protein n=1 Tax=Halomicrococcus sp. NG-SE-24 TaxID=3436928 RepID=UPI003D954FC7
MPSKNKSSYKLEKDQKEKPAIGLIATEENSSKICHFVLQALERDYPVLVISSDLNLEAVQFADRLGAEIVTPTIGKPDSKELRRILATNSKTKSYPGLIIHEGTKQIDFDRSENALAESDYYIDAITEAEVEESKSSTTTLAAIPAYNEAATISQVVSESSKYVDNVLVVDDGSQDDTAELAREAGANVVEHEENSGYGAAIKTTFEEADQRNVQHLIIIDGDGQHDTSDIPKLIEEQRNSNAEIVIGSRFGEGSKTEMPLYRRIGLAVVNSLTNISMGVVKNKSRVKDTQSGFRSYNETAIESLASDLDIGDHMNASTDILYHAHQHGYKIEEVGTTIDYDVDDGSSHNPVAHGLILVSNLLQTIEKDRPITSLGIPGFVSAFLGLGFGYWTFANYISTETFPMGLAITAAFFTLAGIFACFTAIILHSLNTQIPDLNEKASS